MSGAADYPKARAWLETPEGGAWLTALERLLEAREQERGASSNEARETAEQALLAADAALAEATGTARIRRRRMLRALDDLDVGAKVDDADYRNRIDEAVHDAGPAGRARICYSLGRSMRDHSRALGATLANHLTGSLLQMAEGRRSMLEIDRQGVDPGTGAALMLHMGIVKAAGYEAGVRYGNGRIADVLWVEAAAIYNAAAAQLRRGGEICEPASAKTIKDWCVRKRSKHGAENRDRERFERAGAKAPELPLSAWPTRKAGSRHYENKSRLVGTSTCRPLIGSASLATERKSTMSNASDRAHIPGYRGLILDISEATGALCQASEIVEKHGLMRLIETMDMGLVVYEADDVLFLSLPSFSLYCEMLYHADEGNEDPGNADLLEAA